MKIKTNPRQLAKMYRCITKTPGLPRNYEPHLFQCERGGKPPLRGRSWKSDRGRITIKEAVRWMKKGGNVGIAGRKKGPLVLVDRDNLNAFDVYLTTLKVKTRSRMGYHYYLLSKSTIPNIPVEDAGEVRSAWQYCLTPGSYVETDEEEIPGGEREEAGKYTIETCVLLKWIHNLVDLPEIFLKKYLDAKRKGEDAPDPSGFDPREAEGEHSALFDLEVKDIVRYWGKEIDSKKRWTFDPDEKQTYFHEKESSTDANMSVSNEGLLQCWRHLASHNAIQALCVFSGYMTCQEAGSPHHDSAIGPSKVVGDDGAIFHAWKYAKEKGLIPKDDPVPTRGLKHIARKHGVYDAEENEKLPFWAYQRSLKILEEEY